MRWPVQALLVSGVLFIAAGATAQEPTVAPAQAQAEAQTAEVQAAEAQTAEARAVGEHVPSAQPAQPAVPGEASPNLKEADQPDQPGGAGKHAEFGSRHAAGHAEGSGHAEHTVFSKKTFALQLLNFGVLLFILIYFGGRAMNKALRARHEQLKNDIGEAARLRDEAKGKFEAQERRIGDLEKEIAALRASMRQDAEREQARLVESAHEKAKRIQEELRFQLDRQVKEAELVLRGEVATASVKLAEELLRRSVTTDDQRRLAQEFVAGFGDPTPAEGDAR